MEIANEDELCAWLRTRARVHPGVLEQTLGRLHAEEVFSVDDLGLMLSLGRMEDVFPCVTAAKVARALAREGCIPGQACQPTWRDVLCRPAKLPPSRPHAGRPLRAPLAWRDARHYCINCSSSLGATSFRKPTASELHAGRTGAVQRRCRRWPPFTICTALDSARASTWDVARTVAAQAAAAATLGLVVATLALAWR